jgi:hypothetical protein
VDSARSACNRRGVDSRIVDEDAKAVRRCAATEFEIRILGWYRLSAVVSQWLLLDRTRITAG